MGLPSVVLEAEIGHHTPVSPPHPYSAHVIFDLPVSSDALYLFARGSLAGGRVAIVDSEDGRDTVRV